ncbi:MAG: hypothetical protein PHE53_03165 [Thermoguttaceae bacterium]|nr:hypothetical protein [Thermoguttaceae bacterium]
MANTKVLIAGLKKHHFWILCGTAVLMGGISWMLASRALSTQFTEKKTKIDEGFKKVKDASTGTLHNDETIKLLNQSSVEVKQQVRAVWENLYAIQTAENQWPKELPEDFVLEAESVAEENAKIEQEGGEVDKLREISVRNREDYQRTIRDSLPRMQEIIDIRLPKTRKEILQDYIAKLDANKSVNFTSYCRRMGISTASTMGGMGGMSGPGGMSGGMSGGMDMMGGGMSGGMGGGADMMGGGMSGGMPGGADMMGGGMSGGMSGGMGMGGGMSGGMGGNSANRTNRVALNMEGKVYWSSSNIQALWSQFARDTAPTTDEIFFNQEDLWVIQSLLNIVKNTNDTAKGFETAAIKNITELNVGLVASQAFMQKVWKQQTSNVGSGMGSPGPGSSDGMSGGGSGMGGGTTATSRVLSGSGGSMGGMGMSGPGSMGSGGMGGMSGGPGGSSGGPGGSSDGSLGGATAAAPTREEMLKWYRDGRYVTAQGIPLDGEGEPLVEISTEAAASTSDSASSASSTSDSGSSGGIKEYKFMPVRMRLHIDQRRIPKFMAMCSNSSMPVTVRFMDLLHQRTSMKLMPKSSTSGAGGMSGASGGMDSMGSSMGGGGMGGGSGASSALLGGASGGSLGGMGGMGAGGMSGGMSGGMGGSGGATSTMMEDPGPQTVEIEVLGVVVIFNRPIAELAEETGETTGETMDGGMTTEGATDATTTNATGTGGAVDSGATGTVDNTGNATTQPNGTVENTNDTSATPPDTSVVDTSAAGTSATSAADTSVVGTSATDTSAADTGATATTTPVDETATDNTAAATVVTE